MPAIESGKFVVVGGASQVGSHIGEHLLAGGAREVLLLDNLSLGSTETMQPLLADKRCRFVRADVLRLNDLFDPLADADGVFAVAGVMATGIGESPWIGIDVNIRGVQNTLEACRYHNVRKIVFSSSTGVYGAPDDDPTDETSPLRWHVLPPTMALYCASKVVGETLARHYNERYGTQFIALRYTAVYGERQHRRALVGGHIADSCERIRRGQPPIIDGDGRQVHDYIYADDVARANLMAMESRVSGEAINICSGVAISQERIVETVTKACGSDVKPEFRLRSSEAKLPAAPRQSYSRDKAKRLLGWEPLISIEVGIERVLHWVDQRAAAAKSTCGTE
jgi:UDP-glucose 4-epimerase